MSEEELSCDLFAAAQIFNDARERLRQADSLSSRQSGYLMDPGASSSSAMHAQRPTKPIRKNKRRTCSRQSSSRGSRVPSISASQSRSLSRCHRVSRSSGTGPDVRVFANHRRRRPVNRDVADEALEDPDEVDDDSMADHLDDDDVVSLGGPDVYYTPNSESESINDSDTRRDRSTNLSDGCSHSQSEADSRSHSMDVGSAEYRSGTNTESQVQRRITHRAGDMCIACVYGNLTDGDIEIGRVFDSMFKLWSQNHPIMRLNHLFREIQRFYYENIRPHIKDKPHWKLETVRDHFLLHQRDPAVCNEITLTTLMRAKMQLQRQLVNRKRGKRATLDRDSMKMYLEVDKQMQAIERAMRGRIGV